MLEHRAVPWTWWVWLGVPGLLTMGLYAQVFPPMVLEWAELPSLSHGFAVPLVATYLAWCRRDRLAASPLDPSLLGLPVLILGLGGLVVGVQGQESFVARISFPITLVGLTIFLAGRKLTREIWPAIAYLIFMIPFPWTTRQLITYQERLFTSIASAHAVRWLGVPAYQDGVLLQLPNITLEVADACSSIPAMAALLSLAVVYVSLTQRLLVVRLILILATLPFAVASNIIRITTTAAGAYYLGPWTLNSAYHTFHGTVNFLLTLLFIVLLDWGLVWCVGRPSR